MSSTATSKYSGARSATVCTTRAAIASRRGSSARNTSPSAPLSTPTSPSSSSRARVTIRLAAAWRWISVSRVAGTTSERSRSASTSPGPTDGSWSGVAHQQQVRAAVDRGHEPCGQPRVAHRDLVDDHQVVGQALVVAVAEDEAAALDRAGLQQPVDGGRRAADELLEPLGGAARRRAQRDLEVVVLGDAHHLVDGAGLAGARPAGEHRHRRGEHPPTAVACPSVSSLPGSRSRATPVSRPGASMQAAQAVGELLLGGRRLRGGDHGLVARALADQRALGDRAGDPVGGQQRVDPQQPCHLVDADVLGQVLVALAAPGRGHRRPRTGGQPAGIGGLDARGAGERVDVGEADPVGVEQVVGPLPRQRSPSAHRSGRGRRGRPPAASRTARPGAPARPAPDPPSRPRGGLGLSSSRPASERSRSGSASMTCPARLPKVVSTRSRALVGTRPEPLVGEQEGAQAGDRGRRELLVEDGLEGRPVAGMLPPAADHPDGLALDEVGERAGAARGLVVRLRASSTTPKPVSPSL
jgi:hypothetical protein